MTHLLLLLALWWGLVSPALGAEWITAAAPIPALAAPALPADWAQVTGPYVIVHAPPAQRATALALARHGARSYPALGLTLGLPLGQEVHVVAAAGDQRFQALQGGAPPLWAVGTAWPSRGWIFLKEPRGLQREQVLDHELIHVLLGRAFAPARPPTWLDEGMAQVFSGEWGPDRSRDLGRALRGRSPWTLKEMEHSFPRDAAGARLAYAESADFISWLRVEYGDHALRQLVRGLAAGQSPEAALHAATGDWYEEVEETWIHRLRAPTWAWGLGSEDTVWFVVGLLGLVALLHAKRRQLQRRRAIFAAEEAERRVVLRWSHPTR
ncbi:MAG: hypothetical protein JXX28_10995 [Deltaproteobacteria bacterium]|nr:hypothetical protein [Deltaproteobacteria bacterium]